MKNLYAFVLKMGVEERGMTLQPMLRPVVFFGRCCVGVQGRPTWLFELWGRMDTAKDRDGYQVGN